MISPICRLDVTTSSTPRRTFSANRSISITPAPTADCISRTIDSMSSVAAAVWSANRRISRATTRNPRPCSPAFSASIAAFTESRFVWSATFAIVVTTPPIFDARSLIADNFAAIEEVASASSRIVRSTDVRLARVPSATPAVCANACSTSATVRESSVPVVLICRVAAAIWLDDSPNRCAISSCSRLVAESSSAPESSVTPAVFTLTSN